MPLTVFCPLSSVNVHLQASWLPPPSCIKWLMDSILELRLKASIWQDCAARSSPGSLYRLESTLRVLGQTRDDPGEATGDWWLAYFAYDNRMYTERSLRSNGIDCNSNPADTMIRSLCQDFHFRSASRTGYQSTRSFRSNIWNQHGRIPTIGHSHHPDLSMTRMVERNTLLIRYTIKK